MNNGKEMDELEKNLPDDFWRRAFEEATETPPLRVWNTIERRLDESDNPKILPLWGTGLASSRPFIWGTGLAAAVALILVGWWAVQPESANRIAQPTARIQQANQTNTVAASPGLPPTMASVTLPTSRAHKGQVQDIASTGNPLPTSVQPSSVSIREPLLLQAMGEIVAQTMPKPVRNEATIESQTELMPASTALPTMVPTEFKSSSSRMAIVSYVTTAHTSVSTVEPNPNAQASFTKLVGKPLRLRIPGAIQRIVWARPAELAMRPEVSKSESKSRDMWASVSMMPGSFNPSVSVRSAQSSFSNTALVSSATPNQGSVNSRANFSVAYQAGAGVQLTERWSVESGIGYLSAHATVETPGQASLASNQMDALTNRSTGNNTLYTDALRHSSPGNALVNNTPQASYNTLSANTYQVPSVYTTQNLQTISNNYQYVQVPVQAGYQLRPRKRLSIAMLGGIITNIFVRNTVGDALVVTSKDGIYRPLSLAATMGARLRYRSSRQWSASLAGVYQSSLGMGTQADSQVQSHPTSIGMSVGVDYHFQ